MMRPPMMDTRLMKGRTSLNTRTCEEEVQQPAPGHPRQYNCNARPPPRLVRDDQHVAKLKLNIPLFEGIYNPDAYLTWELEIEQSFSC
jgi:hypothetical protein